jgi:integrase
MRVFKPVRLDAQGREREYARWYVEVRDHLEIVRRIPAFTDRKASEELGRNLDRLIALRVAGAAPDVALGRWIETLSPHLGDRLASIGLLDPTRAAAGKPLTEHVSDWRADTIARGCTQKHADLQANRVRSTLAGCHFRLWSDLRAERVTAFLKSLRDAGRSTESSNHYQVAFKGFCRWMVRMRRAAENPVAFLSRLNASSDQRIVRRALSAAECRRLVDAAQTGPTFKGMTGPDRALLYRFALQTGLRWSEIRSLTGSSFGAGGLTVTVKARDAKNRKEATLQLCGDLAADLWRRIGDKSSDAPVFEMRKWWPGAGLLRFDLDGAGIPFETPAGRVDFHGLRHTFVTLLAKSDIHPSVMQKLARHSSIVLTMDRYTHTEPDAERAALESLPSLTRPERAESVASSVASSVAFQGAAPVLSCPRLAATNGETESRGESAQCGENGDSAHPGAGAPAGTRTYDSRMKRPPYAA